MFIHVPDELFDPEKHFKDVPLFQGLFFKRWWKAFGRNIVTLAVTDRDDKVHVYVQCVEYVLPIVGSMWSAFRGPIGMFPSRSVEEEFYRELRRLCVSVSPKTSHIRIQKKLLSKGIQTTASEPWQGGMLDQPLHERIISVEDDIETIVSRFAKNTKRQVRQYERGENDTVRFVVEKTDFKNHLSVVYDLVKTTAIARGFSIYPYKYYETLFEELNENPEYGTLILGYIDEKKEPVSVFLLLYTDTEAYHLFSGTSAKGYDNNMPTLLHYMAIKEVKKQGVLRYNMGGVSSKEWSGIDSLTLFKEKFGGETVEYEERRDIVVSIWRYRLFRFMRQPIVRKIRRIVTDLYEYIAIDMKKEEQQ